MPVRSVHSDNNRSLMTNSSTKKNEKENAIRSNNSNNKSKRGSVFAGDLNLEQDNIIMKKVQARKQALKVVMDTYSGEKKLDDDLGSRRNHIKDLLTKAKTAIDEIERIDVLKGQLKDSYGITDDSLEQMDLELLRKNREAMKPNSSIILTGEEQKRLNSMGPITQYQQAMLDYDEIGEVYQKQLDDSKRAITNENGTIEAIKLARLKQHPMVEATKLADKIMDVSSNEIVGMLINEAKDHVDEEIEENKDKEERIKEEKEKQESEELDKDRANTDMDLVQKFDGEIQKVQQEIKSLIDKQKLIEEDIKGLTVNQQI